LTAHTLLHSDAVNQILTSLNLHQCIAIQLISPVPSAILHFPRRIHAICMFINVCVVMNQWKLSVHRDMTFCGKTIKVYALAVISKFHMVRKEIALI